MGANRILGNQIGFYRISKQSGLLTLVAAGTGTAGHLFALRGTSAAYNMMIQRIKLRWQTTVAFTAGQELAFQVFRTTSHTVAHSGGTAVTLTSPNMKRATRFPAAQAVADARIGTTGALTAGTHTLDTEAIGGVNGFSQAGTIVDDVGIETVIETPAGSNCLIEIAANEGLIVRNEILMGAAGVGRLLVEIDWFESQ